MPRELQRFALLALAAIVVTSGLAQTSRVCCLVEEDDVCCEAEADALPQLAGPDCCDDEDGGGGTLALHDASVFAKVPGRHESAPALVAISPPSRARRLSGSQAPRGVRRVLAPPTPIPRIFATSRFLI